MVKKKIRKIKQLIIFKYINYYFLFVGWVTSCLDHKYKNSIKKKKN